MIASRTFLTLIAANTVVNLASHPTAGRPPRPGEVEQVTYATGQRGERITAADYVRATQTAHRLGRQMAAFHAGWDVLLTPGLATIPPEARLDRHGAGRRGRVLATRVYVLAVHGVVQPDRPAGDDAAARCEPRGAAGDEATLFRLACQLEATSPWIRPATRARAPTGPTGLAPARWLPGVYAGAGRKRKPQAARTM
jgi:Asp-tRNA(Asn)/Glu-tRNA(Gln) amidotransferase A subunit family amidase